MKSKLVDSTGRASLVASILLGLAGVATANPSKLLVLQSEGRAEAKTRAKIDAALVKLAQAGAEQVSLGEITYGDAAALVGCKPEESSCKDEVIAQLAVDEIVIATVTPKPGGLEVLVRRHGKGSPREATATVSNDGVDKLDAIAPLFGAAVPVSEPVTPIAEPPQPVQPIVTTPAKPLDQPAGHVDETNARSRNRLRIAGMAGGGGMFVLGLILWNSASGANSDAGDVVVGSLADLEALRALEAKGDRYARWGNVFVLGGLALGGVSTYFYVKARRTPHAAMSAQLVPVVFEHGAGVGLSFGGAR